MPLLKKKPFALIEPPEDLDPDERVYQVRFTKEIFRNYQEYINRINLYRQRVWTCKSTAKTNLTYEEALVSEKHAIEKVQELPKELVAPALHTIQFSMLPLKDLVDQIAERTQARLFVGAELYAKKDGGVYLCKILKIFGEQGDKTKYEVAWLDRNRKVLENTLVRREDLIQKKLPYSRNILKSFIRESTYRSIPWVLHDKLARKHGISTDPPEELRENVYFQNGMIVCKKKKRGNEEDRNNFGEGKEEFGKGKRKKIENDKLEGSTKENAKKDQLLEEPIRYPIDDLLVQPGADDPVFTERPLPSQDFIVPMTCIGDLLMVWDFSCSFGRLLHLWPFSLEDFENAVLHKDSNLVLIAELHSSLLRSLIKDNGEYSLAVQQKKRTLKITLINWTEHVCDFLEFINITELRSCTATIKRGHYGLLDANTKLGILRELVNQVIETDLVKEKLNEHIEQRQALGASRREEALAVARKKREEKGKLKAVSDAEKVIDGNSSGNMGSNLVVSGNGYDVRENGDMAWRRDGEVISSRQQKLGKSKRKHLDAPSKKLVNEDVEVAVERESAEEPSRNEAPKPYKDKIEAVDRSTEHRREHFDREMEKRVIRTNPLGKDRNFNRYWWFRRDGRIFVEYSDLKQWGYYSTKEELDALMGSLNRKGERERALQKQLEKFYGKICFELQKKSKVAALNIALEEAVLRRSTRVRAPPRESPATAFLRYVNKWKED